MQLQIKNFKPIPILRKTAQKLFENLPTIVLFSFCAVAFFHFVYVLIFRYLQFDTTVLIRYESPKNIVFPAFTLCGCSANRVACPDSSWASIGQEMQSHKQMSIMEIMDNHSLKETELIIECYYFRDSREPENRVQCTDVETVVESIIDGRKCMTYLTILHDTKSIGQEDENGNVHNITKTESGDQYTAFIYIKVNFTQFVKEEVYKKYAPASTVHDSNVIMSIHQTNMIPTMLDSEYIRIEAGQSYEIHFGKQVTKLMSKPYRTECNHYDRNNKPRSRNECIHLCSMKESFRIHNCINHYEIVTRSWLRYLEHWNESFKADRERFCENSDGNEPYPYFVQNRRMCHHYCGRDCTEESYNLVTDSSALNPKNEEDLSNASETVIIIWPDRKMYEMVEHHKEIDIFELIGTLGGHCHIWLGLSAIQLYDVFYIIIQKIKMLWRKFVYCSIRTL